MSCLVTDKFLESVARSENEPLFEGGRLETIEATGSVPSETFERGYGQTGSREELERLIKTPKDALEQLRERLSKLPEAISLESKRFGNIKELNLPYQRILVSLADNLGIRGLDRFRRLRLAIASDNKEGVYKEMLTYDTSGGRRVALSNSEV
jgi:hypothetical protein